MTYEEARAWLAKKQFKTVAEFRSSNLIPVNIPKNPQKAYKSVHQLESFCIDTNFHPMMLSLSQRPEQLCKHLDLENK